jgi:ABC-2 type transport system ATP-binding protein
MKVLEMQGVAKRFGQRVVLQDFDLTVQRGEIFGLLGPNGCGKSTVMNIACGLLKADAGRLHVQAARIGVCPQQTALYRDLLPAENLDFFAGLYGLPRALRTARVQALMQAFALQPHADTRVGQLSGGWQQRLNVACALVNEPELLLLDEPGAAVDTAARQSLWALIKGLRDSGMSILLSTHQLDEAEQLCTRVGLMQEGRIAAQGTLSELIARVPGQAVALLDAPDEAAVARRAAGQGWPVRHYGGRLACLLPGPLPLRDVVQALDGLGITAVSVQPVTLEHAYLELLQWNQASRRGTGSAGPLADGPLGG